MKRGIVIPTYNEHNNIARVITEIFQQDPQLNIIVVDDNSPDGTGDVVRGLSARYSDQIKLITQQKKLGLGLAYIKGFTMALSEGWDLICEMDADLSHNPAYLKDLFFWADFYDLVMGSRYIENGGVQNWNLFRRILSFSGNVYSRTALGVKIRDLTSGFRCYRRQVLESINLNEIHSNGYAFQIETAYRTLLNGFSIKETPIVFVEREEGKSKMSKSIILEAVTMVWRLRWNRRLLLTTPQYVPVPKLVEDAAVEEVKEKVRKIRKVSLKTPLPRS